MKRGGMWRGQIVWGSRMVLGGDKCRRRDCWRSRLTWRGWPKIILMAINPLAMSITSEVRHQFMEPLLQVFSQVTARRNCPVESDWAWLLKGVDRVIANGRSGRDFLQTFQLFWPQPMQAGPYFEKLASPRRLAMVAERSALLRRQVDAVRVAPLAALAALARFEVYAGDGHHQEHTTHDPANGGTHWLSVSSLGNRKNEKRMP